MYRDSHFTGGIFVGQMDCNPYWNATSIQKNTYGMISFPEKQQERSKQMRCFTFTFGYPWSGVVFKDGFVCIRGQTIKKENETHQFNDLNEMLQELQLSYDDLCWINEEKDEK